MALGGMLLLQPVGVHTTDVRSQWKDSLSVVRASSPLKHARCSWLGRVSGCVAID